MQLTCFCYGDGMDNIDKKILELLQDNGKRSLTDMAAEVGLSAPSVNERIKKLEKSGIISRYTAILDAKKTGNDITAFIKVLLTNPEDESGFIVEMMKLNEVQECHHITGDFSLFLKVKAGNMESLKKIVLDEINSFKGVQQTRTILALASYKEDTKVTVNLEQ